MANRKTKSTDSTAVFRGGDGEQIEVELRDPWLAAFLAWLIPGLGHIYQGRTGKGILFFVCILGTFIYGLYIGEGRVVYASTPSMVTRWQYFCQLGVGLPALPALVQRARAQQGKPSLFGEFMRPPHPGGQVPPSSIDQAGNKVTHPDELAQWHYDQSDRFELGTVFTVIAGLLNVLAIYDAYAGPLIIPPEQQDDSDDKASGQREKSG